MRERATALGLELTNTTLRDGEPKALEAILAADRPAAIVLLTVDEPQVLAQVHASGLPPVLVNGDDPRGCGSTAWHPATARPRGSPPTICWLAGITSYFSYSAPGERRIQRRLEGWRDALSAAGLPADEARVLNVAGWVPEWPRKRSAVTSNHAAFAFTAILCAADSLAGGRWRRCKHAA